MANDDKDIDEMLRRIDFLLEKRKRHSGEQTSLADEIQADLDRENSRRRSWLQRFREKLTMARDWLVRKVFYGMYGFPQPQLDGEGLMLLGILLKDGDISQEEWRRAIWQRIIRRADDELLCCVGPSERARLIGKLAGVFGIVIASAFIAAIMEEPFQFFSAVSWSLVAGPTLGVLARPIYDCSWGHEALARKLRYLYPFLQLRLSQERFSEASV